MIFTLIIDYIFILQQQNDTASCVWGAGMVFEIGWLAIRGNNKEREEYLVKYQ